MRLEGLSEKLKETLPGANAHKKLAPVNRASSIEYKEGHKKAAVLITLFQHQDEWNTMVITRASHPLDKHKGQIGFPGGSIEPNESIQQAAVREFEEEIGISSDNISLIGELTPIYIPVSNFKVYPVVATLNFDPNEVQLQASEVEKIHLLPITELLKDTTIQTTKVYAGKHTIKIPAFCIQDIIIWGATGMMMNEFLEILKSNLD